MINDKRPGNGKNQKSESGQPAPRQTNVRKKLRYLDQIGQRKMHLKRITLKDFDEIQNRTRKQAADKIKILEKITREEGQKTHEKNIWGNKPRKQKDKELIIVPA